ncbi:hypothetical protein V5O48_017752 [Marasmius crinis-equi]|uniref:Uncharacterized protein n=1 Tax=Marasmius crinis-equi TaxID=585013 RepID=A0ABR3EN33_9AGAR
MNAEQTNKLIKLIQRVAYGLDNFTINSHAEMQTLWDLAAERSTKAEQYEFEVHARPLWDWLLELVLDKELVSHMEWDARRLYKFDGHNWERIIHEPWTADRWWTLQSGSIPLNGKPLCILIYADKNKLSSFGTAKGYPVIARLLNLPEHIRNSTGRGGGRVVGWLPIVSEDAERTHKTDFVDFKAVVWHESARYIFESIVDHSKTGCFVRCGDTISRTLYPLIMIDSADYEEQCVMCLIRGLMGRFPCPKCLVPKDESSSLTCVYALRTAQHSVDVHNTAQKSKTKAEREEYLKTFSMRPVQNAFLSIANSDPYSAVSFDLLHFFNSGLWGDHMFPQLKKHVANIGRAANVALDNRFDQVPPWRGLNHFKTVSTVSFNDGSHHRDISKIFLFAAYGVITKANDNAAYDLMKALRKYLNVYMYSSLDVQTTSTLASGREAVKEFHECLQHYTQFEFEDPDLAKESWNFIKYHYVCHLFDDIEQKGAQRGFNTMPNEKLHGPLRKIYKLMTNFKDVGKQILRVEHQCLVAGIIRGQLDTLDSLLDIDESESENIESSHDQDPHISLGSKRGLVTFECLEQEHANNAVFSRFRIRLSNFMSDLLPSSNIVLPGGRRIKFQPHEKIVPYQFLKVGYESKETWRLVHDYLRCNPNFRGKHRYDFVIFDTQDGPVFAQLVYMFKCFVTSDDRKSEEYPVALVQPYTVVRQRPRVDKDWGLLRLKKQADSEFVSIQSIVRGALVMSAADSGADEWSNVFVIDVVDADMFLRINEYFPGYTSGS